IVAALGLERVWHWPPLQKFPLGRSLLLACGSTAVLTTTSFQRVELARARFERGPGTGPAQVETLGSIIREKLPTGSLFIYDSGAKLYAWAGRPPATRYLNAEAWRSSAPDAQQTRAELVGALRNNPPPVIALAPHSDEAELNLAEFPSMREFLQACYA